MYYYDQWNEILSLQYYMVKLHGILTNDWCDEVNAGVNKQFVKHEVCNSDTWRINCLTLCANKSNQYLFYFILFILFWLYDMDDGDIIRNLFWNYWIDLSYMEARQYR